MTTTNMKGGSAHSVSSNMLKGMKNTSPKCYDASTTLPKGPSVAAEAVRGGTAPSPKTLGPRDA